ncbi:MAG TPA: NAD-dependent epimerase/dehydratase family protein, partial [Tepidiformaceae bacterium]|nr:NAD-dependent epimerase/dehydratase family protein [Tepidiformaceae bacterium]
LIGAGHDVRLLVRSPEKVEPTFAALGVTPPADVHRGDVIDGDSISRAMEGRDAVLHAASVFSFDRRQRGTLLATNVAGTRHIIETAIAANLDPIVHVSSYGAIVPAKDGRISHDSPPSTGEGPYSASKADSERVAREYQEQGLPVVTVMPGSVWGPADPYLGESHQLAVAILKGQMRMLPRNGFVPIVDVRDLAAAMARVFEPGLGPRRYLMGGQLVSPAGIADLIGELTGKKRRYLPTPNSIGRQGGVAFDLMQRVSPWRLPLTRESARMGTQRLVEVDDSRAVADLGFAPRPLAESVADTVRWLAENGHVSTRQAGRLAAREAVATG